MPFPALASRLNRRWLAATLVLAAACGDQNPATPAQPGRGLPRTTLMELDCRADIGTRTVSCGAAQPSGASRAIYGGQNVHVRLASSNVSFADGIFQFDVTVQNLLLEAVGTPDGVVVDTAGVTTFFHTGPVATGGTGAVWVANADGTGNFTGTSQPYFRYNQKLAPNEVSAAKTWQIGYDPGVTSIGFHIYILAEVQPLLVINEVLANPGGTITDANGEWFEVYNAGRFPVQMQGMVIADSAATGRRPYHVITSSLTVLPGDYVVLGNTTNTTSNGGVTVDYAYGAALALANTGDAVKIARVYGTDTLMIDRVQYASGTISAQNGISRELKNPALDNANMDGSSWAGALVTAVYGPGGRGTPKAQSSTFTP